MGNWKDSEFSKFQTSITDTKASSRTAILTTKGAKRPISASTRATSSKASEKESASSKAKPVTQATGPKEPSMTTESKSSKMAIFMKAFFPKEKKLALAD